MCLLFQYLRVQRSALLSLFPGKSQHPNCAMHLLSVVVVLSAGLNSIVAFAPRGCISNSVFPIARYVISTPLSSAEEDNLEGLNEEDDDPDPPPKGIFQQINDVLDTPILDANDRSNQGPVAEVSTSHHIDERHYCMDTTDDVVVCWITPVASKLNVGIGFMQKQRRQNPKLMLQSQFLTHFIGAKAIRSPRAATGIRHVFGSGGYRHVRPIPAVQFCHIWHIMEHS